MLIPTDGILTLIKIKEKKCRGNYCANCVTSYNLILVDGIELSPEPGSRIKANLAKCNLCDKSVGTNRKRIKRKICHNLTHVKCLNTTKSQQKDCNSKPFMHEHNQNYTPRQNQKYKLGF